MPLERRYGKKAADYSAAAHPQAAMAHARGFVPPQVLPACGEWLRWLNLTP